MRDILTDANSGAIAESIILLSRALGLSVVAEGVETEEQLTSWRSRDARHTRDGFLAPHCLLRISSSVGLV